MTRVGWLDCSSGVSGDMLLGALHELGAIDVGEVGSWGLEVELRCARSDRGGLAATHIDVVPGSKPPPRRLRDLLALTERLDLPPEVRERSRRVFERLAQCEAKVHGIGPDEVHFHELGAVDTVVDVVGVCLGLHNLGLDRLVAGPVALGGGQADTEHGVVPIPGPAVLELLAGTSLVASGGPLDMELATPTGVALLAEWVTESGPMPAMRVERVGLGAGARDLEGHPNVVRLVVGESDEPQDAQRWLLLEANVDDLDPRLWPAVLDRLLATGAADAWLTPILMKKGRPAHTLSALVEAAKLDAIVATLFTESSTIGVRTIEVGKQALERTWMQVDVAGQTIRVKLARMHGVVVNASPEYDDVARAAAALGRPVKAVLADAVAAAAAHLG